MLKAYGSMLCLITSFTLAASPNTTMLDNSTVQHQQITELQKSLETHPKDHKLHILLGKTYLAIGRSRAAEKHFLEAKKLNASEEEWMPLLAEAYLAQHKYSEITKFTNPPANDKLHYILGEAHFGLENLPKALNEYQKILKHNPNNQDALIGIARIKLLQHDHSATQEYLSKTLHINPSNSDALSVMGDLQYARGDLNGALNYYRKALARNSYHQRARMGLAAMLIQESILSTYGDGDDSWLLTHAEEQIEHHE